MREQEDEQQAIDEMNVIQSFLGHEVIKAAIRDVHEKNFAVFSTAKTSEEALSAQARTRALNDLIESLGSRIAKGEFHKATRDRREAGSTKKS